MYLSCDLLNMADTQFQVSYTGLIYIHIPQIQYIFLFSERVMSLMKDLFYFLIKSKGQLQEARILKYGIACYML